jgi:5-methylthioadenosine/S-adenosylhomocysteine deaminase
MTLLFSNATVITQDAARRVLEDAAVAVEGERIAAVGPTADLLARFPAAQHIDASGQAILPGLINIHTHTVLTVLRGTVEDMSGDAIYGYMTPISFAMLPDERAAMARLGALEALRSGCTTLADPFRHVTGYAGAMARSGLRLYLSESGADARTLEIRKGQYNYDRAWGETFLERIDALSEGFHQPGGRVQVQIAAHAPDNCSPWMLRELNDRARKLAVTRTVHLAQSMTEVNQVRRYADRTPAEYLRDNDWLGPDVIAAHWTFCTESDIELCAAHGVHMAHCPANSSRRGPHRVLAAKILDAGINVALGTDNMTEDMFQAMRIGSIVHRGSYGGGVVPAPQHALDAATVNGARALGRSADLGSVEAGKRADLLLLDLRSANLYPIINLPSSLVHYAHPGNVRSVLVDGEFLMRDREVLSMDEAQVLDAAQQATDAAWRRLARDSPDIAMPARYRS